MTDHIYIIIITLSVIFFAVLVWYVATRNSIKHAEAKTEETEAAVNQALTKRQELLSSALEAVRICAPSEASTISSVGDLRRGATVADRVKQSLLLAELSRKLKNAVDSCEKLKENQEICRLREQVIASEAQLADAVKAYNISVKRFNKKLVSVPSSLVANRMCLVEKPIFE